MHDNDHHALLCPPEEKAAREAANGLEQIQYISKLRAADASEKADSADFSEMINFLEDVLMQQMTELIEKLGKSRPST